MEFRPCTAHHECITNNSAPRIYKLPGKIYSNTRSQSMADLTRFILIAPLLLAGCDLNHGERDRSQEARYVENLVYIGGPGRAVCGEYLNFTALYKSPTPPASWVIQRNDGRIHEIASETCSFTYLREKGQRVGMKVSVQKKAQPQPVKDKER